MEKTRKSISSSGAYKFLVLWGVVWIIGFLSSQFFPPDIAGYVWIGVDILGGILSVVVGMHMNSNIRNEKSTDLGKRIAFFWVLLIVFCFLTISIFSPITGKQLAMTIIIFVIIGWISMGLLLSFASVWWGLAIIGLAVIGYYGFPDIFYLLMGIFGGGGMILLGLYIRFKW
jgi:hypothetical protein